MRTIARLLGPLASPLLGLPLLVFVAACGGQRAEVLPTRAPLIVGVTDSTPPYAFRRGEEIVGVEPDFAFELGNDLERPVEFVVLPWEDLLNAVARGRVDIVMNGVTITPEREDKFAFAQPYTRAKLAAMVRREDLNRFSSRASACAYPLDTGVVGGTTGEARLRSRCPAMLPRLYPAVRDAVRELTQYRVDAVIHDAPILAWYASESTRVAVIPLAESAEPLAWVLSLDNTYLRSRVNASLERMRGDGTLETILARWIPASSRTR